jgi:hypothetical protein
VSCQIPQADVAGDKAAARIVLELLERDRAHQRREFIDNALEQRSR